MSSYTMKLRTYIEGVTQNETLSKNERIEKGRKFLFDFEYPLFNDSYRRTFETNFIRNFYHREIGFETEGLFKDRLENWLNVNMPYYNQLLESQLIKFDPLENVNVKENENKKNDKNEKSNKGVQQSSKIDGTAKGTSKVDSSGTAKGTTNDTTVHDEFERKLESDTPDKRLAITTNDGSGVIEYASKITEDKENGRNVSNGSHDGSTTGTESGTRNEETNTNASANQSETASNAVNAIEEMFNQKIGKTGTQSYASMLAEYRKTFLRIEKEMFEEMNELFMLVY